MKVARGAMVILVLMACASAQAEIEGAQVILTWPCPSQHFYTGYYTATFVVHNDSSDSEYIADVLITFPENFWVGAGGYDEIEPGRPSWDFSVSVDGHAAMLTDNNGGRGEVYSTESTAIYMTILVSPPVGSACISWALYGDGWGSEPHFSSGCIEISVVPVESASWGAIKALYR